ncbi:hypothetical protein [Acrocarpospora catenulata]|uniref:hypothetical protein n=1 Tax=Acrocarpospora catenulata TaxID=2836182 RepID=UPI001BD9913A|nr:hypothetical protein [Acrocarpospora catenulata]
MTEKGLSYPQITALVVLMVEGKKISNPELDATYGITIDGADRKTLNQLRLVDSRKEGRAYVHALTDSGWARVARELDAGIKIPSRTSGVMLKALLPWLPRYMKQTGLRLSDLFGTAQPTAPQPETPEPETSQPEASLPETGTAPEVSLTPVSAEEIQTLIRTAYSKLASAPAEWVRLRDVRPLLGDLPKADVDQALIQMIHQDDVRIIAEVNQKTLTPDDRVAAVRIGDQDKHLIAIGLR